jgi:hypothetical protein
MFKIYNINQNFYLNVFPDISEMLKKKKPNLILILVKELYQWLKLINTNFYLIIVLIYKNQILMMI